MEVFACLERHFYYHQFVLVNRQRREGRSSSVLDSLKYIEVSIESALPNASHVVMCS